MKEESRKIHILLSRHHDPFSRVIHFLSGGGYTHVSVALGEDPGCYYSFGLKGFRREHPKGWSRDVRLLRFCVDVTEEQYARVRGMLREMEANRLHYRYDFVGLVLCFLHIPHKIHNRYICSQFVTELLKQAGVLETAKRASTCLPNFYLRALANRNSRLVADFTPSFH